MRETIFQFDEFHFQTPEQIWLSGALTELAVPPMIVVSTATPNLHISRLEFETVKAPFTTPHNIASIYLDDVHPVDVMHTLMTNPMYSDYSKRVLIIDPGKRECEQILESLRANADTYPSGFSVSLLHGDMGDNMRVEPTGHIVATQMVNAGITIKGITAVISSGREIINHYGEVFTVATDQTTLIQQRGRTGRQCDGLFISCRSKTRDVLAVSVPNVWDALHNMEAWNRYGRYNFETNITPNSALLGALDTAISSRLCYSGARHGAKWVQSCQIWWEILCIYSQRPTSEALKETASHYDSLVRGKPYESVEHLYTPGLNLSDQEAIRTAFLQDEFYWLVKNDNAMLGFIALRGARPTYHGRQIGFYNSSIRPSFPSPRVGVAKQYPHRVLELDASFEALTGVANSPAKEKVDTPVEALVQTKAESGCTLEQTTVPKLDDLPEEASETRIDLPSTASVRDPQTKPPGQDLKDEKATWEHGVMPQLRTVDRSINRWFYEGPIENRRRLTVQYLEKWPLEDTPGTGLLCGAYAVHSILSRYGVNITFDDVVLALQSMADETNFFSARLLQEYLREFNIDCAFLVDGEPPWLWTRPEMRRAAIHATGAHYSSILLPIPPYPQDSHPVV